MNYYLLAQYPPEAPKAAAVCNLARVGYRHDHTILHQLNPTGRSHSTEHAQCTIVNLRGSQPDDCSALRWSTAVLHLTSPCHPPNRPCREPTWNSCGNKCHCRNSGLLKANMKFQLSFWSIMPILRFPKEVSELTQSGPAFTTSVFHLDAIQGQATMVWARVRCESNGAFQNINSNLNWT